MRFNKITFTLTIFFLFLLSSLSYGAGVKIGVVDLQTVFEKSSAGKLAKEQIRTELKKMEADIEKKKSEIEAMKKKLDAEIMVMKKEKRIEKEREFRIKINDFKMLQKKYNDELKEKEGILLKGFQRDILNIVRKMGKDKGYTLIIDRVGVLYYPDAIDLTDELIKKYNAQ